MRTLFLLRQVHVEEPDVRAVPTQDGGNHFSALALDIGDGDTGSVLGE